MYIYLSIICSSLLAFIPKHRYPPHMHRKIAHVMALGCWSRQPGTYVPACTISVYDQLLIRGSVFALSCLASPCIALPSLPYCLLAPYIVLRGLVFVWSGLTDLAGCASSGLWIRSSLGRPCFCLLSCLLLSCLLLSCLLFSCLFSCLVFSCLVLSSLASSPLLSSSPPRHTPSRPVSPRLAASRPVASRLACPGRHT